MCVGGGEIKIMVVEVALKRSKGIYFTVCNWRKEREINTSIAECEESVLAGDICLLSQEIVQDIH